MSYRKFYRKALRAAEQAGWTVKEKKAGVMLFPKDKSQDPVMLHETPSDHRAEANAKAELRKRGLDF